MESALLFNDLVNVRYCPGRKSGSGNSALKLLIAESASCLASADNSLASLLKMSDRYLRNPLRKCWPFVLRIGSKD